MPSRIRLKKRKSEKPSNQSVDKQSKKARKALKRPSINFKSIRLWTFTLLISGLIVLGGGIYLWYTTIFTDEDRIFYGMVEESLKTDSVSRLITQNDSSRTENQNFFVTFTPTPLVNSISTVNQINQNREITTVSTETIGTRTEDFVRYTDINIPSSSGDTTDYSKVVNTWAKRDTNAEQGQGPQFLNEAIFTFIPFGNFPGADRAELMQLIRDKDVYRLGRDGKVVYDNARPVYEVTVSIKPRGLVEVLKRYEEMTGLGDASMLNPDQYADIHNFGIVVKIDMLTRHLRQVSYPGESRVETYEAYGLNRNIVLPETSISIEELQGRLQ